MKAYEMLFFISPTLDDETRLATMKRVETAIRTAQALMGRPYALNANPPESFNCAALVYYCFNRAKSGSIRSSLVGQVHDDRHRKIASAADLKRGDLVCFNFDDESDNFGHVGIYLGGGSFIHASNLDDQVTVSTMASGYYQRTFSWGRRIFG